LVAFGSVGWSKEAAGGETLRLAARGVVGGVLSGLMDECGSGAFGDEAGVCGGGDNGRGRRGGVVDDDEGCIG
jgi:hypothetical protein